MTPVRRTIPMPQPVIQPPLFDLRADVDAAIVWVRNAELWAFSHGAEALEEVRYIAACGLLKLRPYASIDSTVVHQLAEAAANASDARLAAMRSAIWANARVHQRLWAVPKPLPGAAADPVTAWLHARCIMDLSASTPFADLYRDFVAWCRLCRIPAPNRWVVGRRLTTLGHPRGHAGRIRTRKFLRLP